MKALVTGGAGFIGSHIAEEICRQGGSVVVLDNLSLGTEKNLGWARPSDSIDFVRGEISDDDLISKIMPGCDWVFHQAALPSVPVSVSKPWKTNEENLSASLKLLLAAREHKIRRFLFASSSAIYGESADEFKAEIQAPSPLSPYALQKYAAEKYAHIFHSLYGLETVCFRYFNVFGPRQSFDSPYSGVIAKFCTVFKENKEPVIFGDGLQSRDFVYIKNVVHANLLAAQGSSENVAGKVFNIGSGRSITLLDLIAALSKISGRNLEPRFQPARSGDIRASCADISQAETRLGYQVLVPWEKGLEYTYDFYLRDSN